MPPGHSQGKLCPSNISYAARTEAPSCHEGKVEEARYIREIGEERFIIDSPGRARVRLLYYSTLVCYLSWLLGETFILTRVTCDSGQVVVLLSSQTTLSPYTSMTAAHMKRSRPSQYPTILHPPPPFSSLPSSLKTLTPLQLHYLTHRQFAS